MTPRFASILLGILGMLAAYAAYSYMKTGLFIAILTAMALAIFFHALSPSTLRTIGYRPAIVALAMPLAAWGMPSILLLFGLMTMLVPLCARKPGEVAPLYLFSLLLLPGLDLTFFIGPLKLFEFGVHDALALGSTFRLLLFARRKPDSLRLLDIPVLALLLLLVTAMGRDTSMTNFVRVLINVCLDYALPYYVVSRSVQTMDDVRLCMIWLACAATILSVILLYEAQASWPMYNGLYDRHQIAATLLVKSRGGVLRAGGPFLESTSMAMVLVLCFLAAWLSRRAFRSKWHYLGILLLLLAGLSAPQSRGAWVGLLIAMLVIDIYLGHIYLLVRRLTVVAMAGTFLLSLAQVSPYLSETIGLSGGSVETVDYRERLLERGIEEFKKSPLTGYSWPEINIRLNDLRQGEGIIDFVNTYVYMALISGAIGLGVFLGAFATFVWLLWLRRRKVRRTPADMPAVAFVFAGVVAPMEMLFFTSFVGRPAVFVFLFFALGVAVCSMRSPAARTAIQPQRKLGAAPAAAVGSAGARFGRWQGRTR